MNRVMPTENASRMTAEAYLDGHGGVFDIQEHLDEVNEAIGTTWSESSQEAEEVLTADMHDAYLRGEYVAQPTVHELMVFGYYMPASSPRNQEPLDYTDPIVRDYDLAV